MTWLWDQSAGEMSRDGKLLCRGYAGNTWGKNNPGAEAVQGIGPLPCGKYKMTELRLTGASTGPYTIVLVQVEGDPHGRSAFRIHGDSIKLPGTASHGCIVIPRTFREQIWNSGDHALEVTT